MLKWGALLVLFAAMAGSLGAMGVGTKAMLMLLVALGVMVGASLLIAWPFLRRQARPEMKSALQTPVNDASLGSESSPLKR